jgi:hypothetical protein
MIYMLRHQSKSHAKSYTMVLVKSQLNPIHWVIVKNPILHLTNFTNNGLDSGLINKIKKLIVVKM